MNGSNIDATDAVVKLLEKMSYEARMPLNAIIGFSQILLDEDIDQKHKESVEIIQQSGEHLTALIKDISDFAKLKQGMLSVTKEPVNLEKILATLASSFRQDAISKGVDFKLIQYGELPSKILTDRSLLKRSLKNLVSNALKFTEQGHVYIKVSLCDYHGKSGINFRVIDTGCGMPQSEQANLFDDHTESKEPAYNGCGNTGLGLPITYEIIKLLDGELSVESEVGKGSVFSVLVPLGVDIENQKTFLTYAEETTEESSDEIPETDGPIFFDDKVLVAEDNFTNQVLVRTLLEKFGLTVIMAENGKEAVELAKDDNFDLCFMDIQMPIMNGYDAIRHIRQNDSTIPIIALTAYAVPGDKEKCLEAGCNDYMTKPIDFKILQTMLGKYLKPVNCV